MTADFFRGRAVLVTGGTGFIGRRLILALQAREARLRVLTRRASAIPPDWRNVEPALGDLGDAASLTMACCGVDTVIHAAGFAHADAGDTPDFGARHWAINAEGSYRLLDAAAVAGVKRFVFLSSVKAVGDPGARCVDESWDRPPETPYGRAKRAAEERVVGIGRERGLHAVNLRPALVYGPGMKANLARLFDAARRGWLPPLPETGNRRSLVHADDVAQAALLGAAHPAAAGHTYFVTDGVAYSGRKLYLILRAALERPIPRWTVPAGLLRGGAKAADGLLWLCGRGDRRARAALDKLLGWACYDATRIGVELGYCPLWTLERYSQELLLDILPALKDGDSHHWRSMSRTEKDI